MSRSRLSVLMIPVLAIVLLSGCATTSAGGEDLEKKVDELTKRVAALEKQLQTLKASGGAPNQAQEAAAQKALGEINQLVAQGKVEEAKAKLAVFQKQYSATRTGRSAQRVASELAVVGKTRPTDWKIEKWFQGQSDIDLASNDTTVVVFWETWCPHCRREVPKLQKMYETYKGQGLQVVGLTKVNKTSTDEGVATFVDENKMTYPVAKEDGTMSQYFGVSGVPAAAVLKDGKVIWRGHPVRITDDMLKAWL